MSQALIRTELDVENAEFVGKHVTNTEGATVQLKSNTAQKHTVFEVRAEFETGHNKGVRAQLSTEELRKLRDSLNRVLREDPD